MLIETARRVEADVKELVEMTNRGGLGSAELREALSVSKTIKAALSAFQANAASIVSKMERHGDGGAGVLAEAAGLSRRDARGRVKTAEAISAAPSVRDAFESGRVSEANARRLAEAVERTSAEAVEADAGLLARAERLGPEQFAKEARRWAADRQHDGGEREYRRLRAKRSVHIWDDEDGTVQLHGVFDPVTGKRIGNRLRAEARRMHDTDKKAAAANDTGGPPGGGRSSRRGSGPGVSVGNEGSGGCVSERDAVRVSERRSFEQCMADALDNLTSRTPTSTTGRSADERPNSRTSTRPVPGTGPSPLLNTRPDTDSSPGSGSTSGTDTLAGHPNTVGRDPLAPLASGTDTLAGHPNGTGAGRSFADISVIAHVDDTTGKLIAELPDGARLPAAVLEQLSCNARLTGLVYDTAGTPIWRAKSVRTATEGQRRWLLDRWGGCFHCSAHPDMCQIHHITPVSAGGATKIDNMVPVCWDCHNKIHHQHWQIRKHPDGQHTLHPPNHTHYGPAHAPEQPLPLTQDPPTRTTATTPGAAGRERTLANYTGDYSGSGMMAVFNKWRPPVEVSW